MDNNNKPSVNGVKDNMKIFFLIERTKSVSNDIGLLDKNNNSKEDRNNSKIFNDSLQMLL